MATRNRSKDFLNLRERTKGSGGVRGAGSKKKGKHASLLGDDGSADADQVRIQVGLSHTLPPEWVDVVESIQRDVHEVKDKTKELQRMHTRRLKVTFNDQEVDNALDQDRDIDVLTKEITRLLHKNENSLKRIATIGNDIGTTLAKEEKVVRLNVMRALASQLQGLSKTFRLRGQEESGSQFFEEESESKSSLSLDAALDRGLSASEVAQLQSMEQAASENEKEIIRIAQSINDLATIFRELSVLVIEQGTILDRIDYNIEQTMVKVQDGREQLEKAENYSKKAFTIKCILLLFVVIVILTLILIFKHSGGSSSN